VFGPGVVVFAYIAVPGLTQYAAALALMLVPKAMPQDYDQHLSMKYIAKVADIFLPLLRSQYILDRTSAFVM
jgi:hypothetical protein